MVYEGYRMWLFKRLQPEINYPRESRVNINLFSLPKNNLTKRVCFCWKWMAFEGHLPKEDSTLCSKLMIFFTNQRNATIQNDYHLGAQIYSFCNRQLKYYHTIANKTNTIELQLIIKRWNFKLQLRTNVVKMHF